MDIVHYIMLTVFDKEMISLTTRKSKRRAHLDFYPLTFKLEILDILGYLVKHLKVAKLLFSKDFSEKQTMKALDMHLSVQRVSSKKFRDMNDEEWAKISSDLSLKFLKRKSQISVHKKFNYLEFMDKGDTGSKQDLDLKEISSFQLTGSVFYVKKF